MADKHFGHTHGGFSNSEKIRIGVSKCLLGVECRWNGGHKRDGFVVDTLGPYVEYVSCCPEFDIGLGIPRETLRLVATGKEVRLMTSSGGSDYTDVMIAYSKNQVKKLEREGLSAYILKRASPSCGMERVKLYNASGFPSNTGVGIFAGEVKNAFPTMPIEEEGRLSDPALRESFIERLFVYRRVVALFGGKWQTGDLVAFHTAQKLLLMSHDPQEYSELGGFVADCAKMPPQQVSTEYRERFMRALSKPLTRGKHCNVLMHMIGYFRGKLSAEARAELLHSVEDYREGLVPLVVPMTLIAHYARLLKIDYLLGQSYIDPHPKELALRNYVSPK